MQHWFQIVGSKSRNISNVKEILPSQKTALIFIPPNLGVFPHHSTVCFHERQLLGLPAFYSWQLLSPLSRPSPHLLFSLHMCCFRKQISYDNIWPKESIVWWLLSLISGGKLTYGPVLSHRTGKKGAGTSLQQEWIQRLNLSLYLSSSWLCWWCLATYSPSECGNRNSGCRQFQPHSCSSLTLDQANGAFCGFPENDSRSWWACLGCLSFLDSSLWFKGWQCDWQAHQNVME